MQESSKPSRKRIQPLRALRAVRELIANPDDTAKVFDIIDALSGNTGERLFRRFRATETGSRILAEKRNLLATLEDRAYLESLPPGSLGRAYAEFMSQERLSGQGLVEASKEYRREDIGFERRLFADRLRDMHDLWHVVTGYGRDLVGEAALLAFSFAQTRNPGVGFIVAVAWLKAKGEASFARPVIVEGYRRGRRARWLPAADWEALLPQPLERVREELNVGTPPEYVPVRSAGAPAAA